MGSPGKGNEDLQHRLSRRAAEGFCDLQASGGKPMPARAQGKKRCHEERGDAIMRRRGWGGASSSRLSPRLCFPGLLWMLRDVA